MYGWSPWWMWLTSAVFLAVVIWLFIGVSNARNDSADPARRILDVRLARGEIDHDEYRERLAALVER